MARQCCQGFAGEVLRHIQREEDLRRELVSGRITSGSPWIPTEVVRERAEAELAEWEPVSALVREWCGQEALEEFDQVAALREEVDRLRDLLEDAVRWLRDSGHPVKATLLSKQVDGER